MDQFTVILVSLEEKKQHIVLATKLSSSGSPQAQLLYDSIKEREGEISLTFRKIELFIVVCRSPISSVWWADGGGTVTFIYCILVSALGRIMGFAGCRKRNKCWFNAYWGRESRCFIQKAGDGGLNNFQYDPSNVKRIGLEKYS